MRATILLALLATLPATLLACGGPERRSYHADSEGPTYVDPPDVHLEGDRITIDDHIHFAHDSDEILQTSSELLDHIAEFLQHHEEITALHLVGHTDATGTAEYNQELSERRAAAVRRALEQRGVTQPIDSRGAGQSERLCQENTDACHRQNRRVEFRVDLAS
mgnify:CR=1 FL=1